MIKTTQFCLIGFAYYGLIPVLLAKATMLMLIDDIIMRTTAAETVSEDWAAQGL